MGKTQTFESALKRLEKIVEIFEEGDTSLEEMLKLFEEGAGLASFCNEKLENTKQKVAEINIKSIAGDAGSASRKHTEGYELEDSENDF